MTAIPMTATTPAATPTEVVSARRVRTAVRAVLTLAVAASVIANVLHAQPSTVGRAIAAWPPLALLLTVELISRVPVHSRRLAALRMLATGAIAGIAAWVSYWHMVDVAHTHGETETSAHLIPLSVDGLVIVASICLVEIGARLRALTVDVAPAAVDPLSAVSALTQVHGRDQRHHGEDQVDHDRDHNLAQAVMPPGPEALPHEVQGKHHQRGEQAVADAPRPRGTGNATAVAVARLRRRHPDWTAAQIAARLDVHPSTVRRHLNAHAATATSHQRRSPDRTSANAASTSADTGAPVSTPASTDATTQTRTHTSTGTSTGPRTSASTHRATEPAPADASADAPAA